MSRERLLDAATELFYVEGIRGVGVDTVVAKAGVSKPTLYTQFGSKANLIAAVLDRRRRDRQEALERYLGEAGGDARHRMQAVFEWLAQGHGRSGFRGCPFTNAAVELPDPGHPARAVIVAYKDWLRSTLAALAAEAGLSEPDELGSDLLLLIDGANVRVVVPGDRTAMRRAGVVAGRLITHAAPTAQPASPTSTGDRPADGGSSATNPGAKPVRDDGVPSS